MQKYLWKIKSKSTLPTQTKDEQKLLLEILSKNRGLTTKAKMDKFLNPTLDDILAVEISDLKKGVKRVINAIKNKEKIIIYSDYDADGICATAIMWETLNDLSADVMPYVPDRIKEGYGLSTGAISELAEKGVNLIVTVDHGVTAKKQVEHANKLGVDIVITDHHVLPKELPDAIAIVHSTEFCGAGVSWRFCYELISQVKPAYLDTLIEKLELAAFATIADLIPLIGGARAMVKIGLEKLQKTKRLGILALAKECRIQNKIGTYEISHILGPRINASGRILNALDSLRLLCAKNRRHAEAFAKLLCTTNTKRQDLTTKAVTEALNMVNRDTPVGIIFHESFHEGVIGLVASRLVEAYNKPMIVISKGEKKSKGSARSIPGFNIVEAIRASSEFLIDGGGHPMAAGFSIETKHIEAFSNKIHTYAQSRITEELLTPVLSIECQLPKAFITPDTEKTASMFAPYGMANPEPVFLTKGMLVEDVRCVGPQENHLKLQLDGLGAIGFNKGSLRAHLRPGYLIDLVYTIAQDNYSNNGQVQMKIRDLELSDKN